MGRTEHMDYLNRWSEFHNSNKIDKKGSCYKHGPEEVKMVLAKNEKGIVEKVVANIENEKSQCFASSYLGVNFPGVH